MVLAAKSALHVPLEVDPLTTQLMPAGVLLTTPVPVEPAPGATVSRCAAAVKATLTAVVTALTVAMLHVPPVHPPPKPSKLPPFNAPASRVTTVPGSKLAEQIPLPMPAVMVHAIPDGELLIVPLPVPLPDRAMIPAGGTRYVTSATRDCDIVTAHGLPTQSPLHP